MTVKKANHGVLCVKGEDNTLPLNRVLVTANETDALCVARES